MQIDKDIDDKEKLEDKLNLEQIIVSDDTAKSYKIEGKFAGKLKSSLQGRLEAIWPYTLSRIERINRNIDSFHAETNDSGDSIIKTSLMTVRSTCEDWIDVIYTSLRELKSSISIEDSKNKLNEELSRIYPVDKKTLNKDGITRMMWDGLEQTGETEKFEANQTFRFDKAQLVKHVILDLINKSDFLNNSNRITGRSNLEEFCYNGVVTGMFAIMNTIEPINNIELEISKSKVNLSQETCFKFKPVDPRSIFFPKNANIPWFAHVENISFSDLVSSAMSEDGNQDENSIYNLDRLKLLSKYLKENKTFPTVMDLSGDSVDLENVDVSEMMENDGIFTVWTFHYVPVVFPGDKLPTRSLITAISLNDSDILDSSPPELFIIGARKTPYIFGLPLHITNFAYDLKKKDPQGIGLPQVLEEISMRTQNTLGQVSDLIYKALMGIHFINEECIEDISKLEHLKTKMFIPIKNANGMPISAIISSWSPETTAVNLGMQFIEMLKQAGKSIARSGLSGESIKSGQVSATEFASVKRELDKQNIRPMMRFAGLLEQWMLDMYRYSAMYSSGPISVICKGKRFFDQMDQTDKEMGANITSTEFEFDREISLDVQDWFVNGIGITLKGITSMQSDAVAKQQAMEAINLILSQGLFKDPQTGQNMIIQDEDGRAVTIDIKSIIEQALTALGYDRIWMPAQPQQQMSSMSGMPIQDSSESGPGPEAVPTSSESIPVSVDKPGLNGIIGGQQ